MRTTRTIVVLTIRPKEERRALQRGTRDAELLDLRDVRGQRRRVLVRLRGLFGVEVSAHGARGRTDERSERNDDDGAVDAGERDGQRGRYGWGREWVGV